MNHYEITGPLFALQSKSKAYLEKLNSISQGIKTFESSLQAMDMGVVATVDIASAPLSSAERESFRVRNIPHWQFLNANAKESIAWDRDNQSGKFRLLYCRTIIEERVATGGGDAPSGTFTSNAYGCSDFPDGEVERKPLIECSSEIRLRAWPNVVRLIEAVSNSVDEVLKHGTVG